MPRVDQVVVEKSWLWKTEGKILRGDSKIIERCQRRTFVASNGLDRRRIARIHTFLYARRPITGEGHVNAVPDETCHSVTYLRCGVQRVGFIVEGPLMYEWTAKAGY